MLQVGWVMKITAIRGPRNEWKRTGQVNSCERNDIVARLIWKLVVGYGVPTLHT